VMKSRRRIGDAPRLATYRNQVRAETVPMCVGLRTDFFDRDTEPISDGGPAMTTSLFGGFGDQSLRKIVGELPTRYETAAAFPPSASEPS
jgi:hypothetical protein